jgi:asparagine synthase (glutamine-hydrolysing)
MCGIYGEVALTPDASLGASADRALDLLTHRGPDDRGLWRGEGAVLGARRLSIIDLPGGAQPIWNEDRTLAIVYNGETYNFEDLRPQLEVRGHRFRTRTDTEVVLHAFEEWGPACLHRLNGMFAFAVWDVRRRRLFLARDRIGEKPLYYHHSPERVVFASEIKALLADPRLPRDLDPRGLVNFLTYGHGMAPRTILASVRKLPPGHFLLVEDGGVRIEEYWDAATAEDDGGAVEDEGEAARQVGQLLDDSVRRRLVADVPVGAFLSGGVDSSTVVALMRRHASGPVRTFSLGFGLRAHDELAGARRVARALGTEHHELHATDVDLVKVLRTLVYHYDEPFGDTAAFPLYLLSRFAREHVKVVLTGDGGDELFGGYRRYAADRLSGPYRRFPGASAAVPAAVGALPRLRRATRAAAALGVADPGRRSAAWVRMFPEDLLREILAPPVREAARGHDPVGLRQAIYGRPRRADHLNRLMYVDLETLLPDAYMEKTDKATMAASLEARQPFLDHRLVELAFRIPGRAKVRGWSTKRVLKRAVRGLVPGDVLRKRKHGFSVPTDPWFRGPLRGFAGEVLLDPRARRRGLVEHGVVERMWREHGAGRAVWDEPLWLLLVLELWHRVYLDGEGV